MDESARFAVCIQSRQESCPTVATAKARNSLNPQSQAIPSENVTLLRMSLGRQQDLVSLRRETRAAAEQCGLDDRSVRSLSAASYEAARLLLGESQKADAEISVTPSDELQISLRIKAVPAAERQSVGRSVSALASVLHRVALQESNEALLVTLTARLPASDGHALRLVPPSAQAEPEPPELVEENVKLRRALIELQDELTETNRGVVALYAELENQAECLRQAEERLRILLDSVHDYAICMLDLQGSVVSWNRGAERVFGYQADAIIGRHIGVFYPPAERDANVPAEHLRMALEKGRFECDSLRVRHGGSAFDALVMLVPMRTADGGPRGFALVVQDITERKRLEDSLRSRADDLAAANRAKEDFLATLSHELRTPLNAMLGWTRLLRMGKLDASARARALETIERNAHVQEQLIADILDVSRIVTGRLRLDLRPIELAPVVDAAIETLQPSAAAKGVDLSCRMARTGKVLGDPDRLQQVVWNLLSNAIKFTPAGGHVSVVLARAGAAAVISVTDTGDGIPASLLPYVFDRFTQGDSSVTRLHGGLGLGLSIVRHIVELHGGQVAAGSAGPGHGAAFSVTLPLRTLPPIDEEPQNGYAVPADNSGD